MDVKLLAAMMRSQMLSLPLLSDNSDNSIDTGNSSDFSQMLSMLLTQNTTQTPGSGNNIATQVAEAEALGGQAFGIQSLPDVSQQPSSIIPFSLTQTSSADPTQTSGSYDQLITATAHQYGLDPSLVRAVVRQESGFNAYATSPVGAGGLMQLMPDTAKSLGVTNVYDPAQNIEGGVKYLKSLIDRYNGDVAKALAAYNAGPGNVDKYGGVPPFGETQRYVANILSSVSSNLV